MSVEPFVTRQHYRRVIMIASIALLGACASGTGLPAATPTTNHSQSAEWAAEGERLRDHKREQAADPMNPYPNAVNAGDYAFASDPIDISGPGTYTLRFVVDKTFDWPNSPAGFSLNMPVDFVFDYAPQGVRMDVEGSTRLFLMDLQVRAREDDPDAEVEYVGLIAWVY